MRIVAVINQKGGVGKTTATANLGHALAQAGQRVTLFDLDPQGHLSASLGIFRAPVHGLADMLTGERGYEEVVIDTRENLHLVPAGQALREIEGWDGSARDKALLLKNALAREAFDKDLLLLDCPPSSGLLVANAILAADEALVPVSGDYLSLNGLAHLMITLKRFEPLRDKPLKVNIFLSRFVTRRRLSREVVDKLQQHFAGKILATPIREAAALAECPGVGRTIFEYRGRSPSAEDFRALAEDLLQERKWT